MIKYVVQIFEKAIIISFWFMAMWPKKIGLKKQIINVILPIFLLNNSSETLDVPNTVRIEKIKFIVKIDSTIRFLGNNCTKKAEIVL